jgi:tetratricopeptide (TPR) repeat protein
MKTPYIETSSVAFKQSRHSGADADTAGTRFSPGNQIGDRFVVKHCLRGGMGEVYLSYDRKWNRPVALKTFRSQLAKHPSIHARLRKEVSHWVTLGKHSNVVQCFGVEVIDSLPFIVIEWVIGEAGEGTSLRDRIERGPLSLREALQFAIDICRGLMQAGIKSPGFVHRDIKPENVLVTGARVAKITDFGLATLKQDLLGTPANPVSNIDLDLADRRASRSPACGHSRSGLWSHGIAIFGNNEMPIEFGVGTPGYRSPEQVSGRELDQRSDLFSVACTLYEMLTGRNPSQVVGAEHVTSESRQLAGEAMPPTVPESLRETLWACLEESVENRLPTVRDLLAGLCQVYESEFGTPPRTDVACEADAYEAGSRSVCLAELGLLDQALTECRLALSLQPHNASLHSVCGVILDRMEKYDDAIHEFSTALAMDSDFAEAYVNRGLTYERTERHDDALADYQRAIELNPGLTQAYLNRAGVQQLRGCDDAALADFNHGIELSPYMVEAYLARAAFFFMRGMYDEALSDYRRAIDLDVGSAAAITGRGSVFYARGEQARAMEDFDRAIELDPSYGLAHRNIGVILRDQGNLERALWYVEKAAELGDKQANKFVGLGHVELAERHRSDGELDKACEKYAKAIAIEANEAGLWFNRGMVHWEMGRLTEALRDYSEGLRLDPVCARAHGERALLYSQLGQEQEAFADFDCATQLAPDEPDNYLNRGNAHLRAGRETEALADYQKSLSINPDLALAYNNMGTVHANRGELREAYKLFSRAAELGDLNAARYARQSARGLGIPVPPPPLYAAEIAWDRFSSTAAPDELRRVVRECPRILSDAFVASVENLASEAASDSELRGALRQRLSFLHELRRNEKVNSSSGSETRT